MIKLKNFFTLKKKRVHDEDSVEVSRLVSPDTPFAVREAYSKLCTNIMYLPAEEHCKTIVMTSAIAGEGKTLLSANIAISLSHLIDKGKILLIDSDMRCSRVNRLFNGQSDESRGLSEYLAGIDEVPHVKNVEGNPNLYLLSAGAKSPNPAGLLSSKRLSEMLENFKNTFDYIIIDTPPIGIVTDALLYSTHVNGYIISVRSDYSNINLVNETIRNIKGVNGNVFGVVLNSLNPKYDKRGSYYGYGSYN